MLKNSGVWTGIFLLGYVGVLFSQSLKLDYVNQLGPGPGFLPLWLSGIMGIITLLYIWESVRDGAISVGEIFPRGGPLRDILYMLGGLAVLALIIEYVGFTVSAGMLLFLMTMRRYTWYYALPISFIVSFLVLFTFQTLLGVPLPVNEFGW